MTADVLHERLGQLVRRKYSRRKTARTLKVALQRRIPAILVTDGVLKPCFRKYETKKQLKAVGSMRGRGASALRRVGRAERRSRGICNAGPNTARNSEVCVPEDTTPTKLFTSMQGGALQHLPVPGIEDAPAWAYMVLRRLCLLQKCIRLCEEEKCVVLVSKLYDALAVPVYRKRWATWFEPFALNSVEYAKSIQV